MKNTKEILQLYSNHAGKILSNFAIVFFALSLLSLLMPFLYGFYFVFLIFIVIMTLGLIFVWYPNFSTFFTTAESGNVFCKH